MTPDQIKELRRLLSEARVQTEFGVRLDFHTVDKILDAAPALLTAADELAALRIEHALHVDLLTEARREGDEARATATRVVKEHESLSILINGPDSRLPKDVRDRVKLGRYVADAAADLLIDVVRERDELRASLDNERGEGAGPSEGWEWTGELGGNEWRKREGAPDEDSEPIDLYVRHRETWYEEGTDERPWAWHVAPQLGQGDEGDDVASGAETTAREAMRAADLALKDVL